MGKCSRCGTESDTRFCPNCGMPMEQDFSMAGSVPVQENYAVQETVALQKKKSRRKLVIGLIAGFVSILIITFGVYYGYVSEQASQEEEYISNLFEYTTEVSTGLSDAAVTLYKKYASFISMATNPTGSYNSYSDDFSKLDKETADEFNQFIILLPD